MREPQADPAKIIIVTNQKGGSGKTTTAVNLSAALHRGERRVLLVEADPQNSVAKWFDSGEGVIPFPYINLAAAKKSIQNEIKKHLFNYDYIVIDGRPSLELDIGLLLVIADIVVVPLRPTMADLDATEEIIQEIEKAAERRGDKVKFGLVLNQVMGQRTLLKLTEKAIADREYHLFQTAVAYAECQPQAYTVGKTVFEFNSYPFRKAAKEAIALADEIVSMIEVESHVA